MFFLQGGITWPLQIHPDVTSSPWFKVLTERAQEAGTYHGCLSELEYVNLL